MQLQEKEEDKHEKHTFLKRTALQSSKIVHYHLLARAVAVDLWFTRVNWICHAYITCIHYRALTAHIGARTGGGGGGQGEGGSRNSGKNKSNEFYLYVTYSYSLTISLI